jgi:hypothetical protein
MVEGIMGREGDNNVKQNGSELPRSLAYMRITDEKSHNTYPVELKEMKIKTSEPPSTLAQVQQFNLRRSRHPVTLI